MLRITTHNTKRRSSQSSSQAKIDKIIHQLTTEHRGSIHNRNVILSVEDIRSVCMMAREAFLAQPMCIEVKEPLCVVGDIHGQFDDLLRIFDYNNCPSSRRFLFLGDYVDRGKNSIEVIVLLMCYKLRYPDNLYMLRGNHESEVLNMHYGFYDECKRRYTIKLFKTFVDCYNCMPVAAVISNRIFCCHGGLSPDLSTIEDINHLERPAQIPVKGLLCDLMWSDPENIFGWGKNNRGVSVTFGRDIVERFIRNHDFDLIVRAHQVVEEGFEFFAKRQLITLFSAPNYCGEFDNAGATMNLNSDLKISFHVFSPKIGGRAITNIITVAGPQVRIRNLQSMPTENQPGLGEQLLRYKTRETKKQ
ncbi:serine/threonine-protein phosphatase alpha-2 isoform-like [Scaptodrosophila lebanonensis]|uniref:Serine/threonine-protein phosphatase n=1 Tax=Drosophila lebanonensis TaxID=7225 RepID=A0A6J2U455_DROLE|nr:serine/threonine-protein phosphatase alpha-2 isoform-like [Scaptodrosophila lebanonensis]